MALIRDVKTEWSAPIQLESSEIWQARSGSIFITTTIDPESDDGLTMVLRDGVRLGAGLTVRYRKEGKAVGLIAREVVQ